MHRLQKFLLFHVLTCLARGSEIINGEKAKENSLLYMASVQNNMHHVCGGFLITEDFVVTAAHCDRSKPTSIVLGTHNLRGADNERRDIEQRYKYPAFKDEEHGDDIMLLKLSQKARLDNRVKTIQLPRSEMNIEENLTCRVAGWGATKTSGGAVDELREVDVSIINLQVCKEKWSHLPANIICAGGYGTNKGFCQGDSGGPLVCNGMAVGVVSFNSNSNCNYPDVPNVYLDISKYLPWINKILNSTKHHE